MKTQLLPIFFCLLLSGTMLCAQPAPPKPPDTSPHTVQFIPVEKDVNLEVLDWGGSGRPLVFLAGSGFTAHSFDAFAPKLTGSHHVYGITRRGFGASSAPEPANGSYSADHLGDDVLAVIAALKLDQPVLVGHSMGGEELSSIGSRHPEKVAGLIYLDAGYAYAYYSPSLGNTNIDAIVLKKHLDILVSRGPQGTEDLQTLQSEVAQLDRDLQQGAKQRALMPPQPPRPTNAPSPRAIDMALGTGMQKYTKIDVPILAIFADPHDFGSLYKDDPAKLAAVIAHDRETTSAQADAFQSGLPSSRVVRIPNANHFIFNSNAAQVLQEMNAFLATLP